jgi:hypothetical protein
VTTWTFIYMMVILKIPIALLLYIVWWAIHQTPDEEPQPEGGDGGSRRRRDPRGGRPRTPRRDPHGAPTPAPPPRVRSVVARGRRVPER